MGEWDHLYLDNGGLAVSNRCHGSVFSCHHWLVDESTHDPAVGLRCPVDGIVQARLPEVGDHSFDYREWTAMQYGQEGDLLR